MKIADVKAFRTKFDQRVSDSPVHLTSRRLAQRANFMLEELREFADASGLALHNDKFVPMVNAQSLAGQADALVDLVYVALGTASLMGLPWDELWDDVHQANMRKLLGSQGDVVKPPGWRGPQTEAILEEAGYDPDHPDTIDDPGRPR
jgi:predicted HAD superfamily Cof-like phosphohydrolase